MTRRSKYVTEAELEAEAHRGFGRALLFALIGFALGAGATFLAWRYNFLTLTAGAPVSSNATAPTQSPRSPIASKPNEAAPAALLAAAQNSPSAQNDLGVLYQLGRGVEQNDAAALKWYRKSAERNFPLAQSNLGWMLEQGRGVDKDPVSALFWYKLAAQGGDPNGQYNLALMYEQGLGTARDRTLALEWFEKVAQQGHTAGREAAARLRAELAQEGGGEAGATATATPSSVAEMASEGQTGSGGLILDVPVPAQGEAAAAPLAQSAAPTSTAGSAVATALSLSVDVDNEFDGAGYTGTWHQARNAPVGNQVTYRAQRRGDRVVVAPNSAFHAGASAAPVAAESVVEALQWQLPRLALRLENTTSTPLRVAALEVRVESSEADRGALVFVPSQVSAMLELENLGWGRAARPQLKLGFAPASEFAAIDPANAPASQTLTLEDLQESSRVALKDRLPEALSSASAVTVFGTLTYGAEGGEQRTLPFKSLAHLNRTVTQRRWQPRYFHHVLLHAGRSGSTTLPVAGNVGAQRSAQVKLRIGSDRSARYELVLVVKGADGALLATQPVELHIFVPRSEAGAIVGTPSPLKISQASP